MQHLARKELGGDLRRPYALVLGALAFAFFLRVMGQVLVAFFDVRFLPPMAQWTSGLLPYSVLLPIQLLILVVQAQITVHIWRGSGLFAICRPRAGRVLCWFSCVYFAATALRYVLTMGLHPERRWFNGTIPIFFHFVLAAFVLALGWLQVRADRNVSPVEQSLRSKRR